MEKRVLAWNHKHFSKGGKEVLIKAVLQAIPTYVMSCFRIPSSICKDMESIYAKFRWEGVKNKKSLHWKTWDKLCASKEEGGMGFRWFKCFNQTLLAKQVWRMIVNHESLISRVFKTQYFRSVDIMEAHLGSNPSFVWRSIYWGREL